MNNSGITLDDFSDPKLPNESVIIKIREREAKVVKIIEAIQEIQETNAWSSLKETIFDSLVTSLERDLKEEARKDDPSTNRLNRLSGELKWAERFSDLSKLENRYRIELQGIRIQLHGKSE